MEECMRKKELEGKELNPETCLFVKKCPPGKVRNSNGKCVKGVKQSANNGAKAPTVRRTRREIMNETANQWTDKRGRHKATHLKFNRHKPTEYEANNYKRGPPTARLRKPAGLYANPPANSNYSQAWRSGISELRNSLNLENERRGIVREIKERKRRTPKKNESPGGISVNSGLNLNAPNNVGLVFDAAHNGKPKLLRKIESATEKQPEEEDDGLLQMFEAQQPPAKLGVSPNTRRLQRRKAKNKERKTKAKEEKLNSSLLGQGTGF
jgi:hypothetical protein